MSKMIIAHRGASAYLTENTMESYVLAMDQGADMIEIDVRKTRDNVLISYHEIGIEGQPIKQLSFKEISCMAEENGFEIPRLNNILRLVKGKIKLDVELKEGGYENTVLELIRQHLSDEEFIITSFNDDSLRNVKDLFPRIRVGLILGKKNPPHLFKTRFEEIFPLRRFYHIRADYLVVHWKLIRFGILGRVAKYQIPVLVWTLNERGMIVKCLQDKRISGIITDKPDLVRDLKNRFNDSPKKH